MIDFIKSQVDVMEELGADSVSIMINFKQENSDKKYLVHINILEEDESEAEENGD